MYLDLKAASNGDDICDLFSSCFSSVYCNRVSASPIFDSPSDFSQTPEQSSHSLSTVTFSKEEVLSSLKNLDRSKGAGPDEIPALFAVGCAEALCLPLTMIYNKSLTSSIFPTVWKEARIVPIHKSGDTSLVNNYRPISILPIFGKVFESLLCPILSWHLKQLISPQQYGFIKARSTTTNLISFSTFLTESVDARIPVDSIYTDFSKAFDTVDHGILLRKLSHVGISDGLLAWCASYLEKRYSRVVVNGFSSKPYLATTGVPQGSHLGPVLFNIFIDDITTIFKNSTCFLYADDLKLCKPIKNSTDMELLQEDLDRLALWCKTNKMTLNIDKCKHIRFSRNKTTSQPYTIDSQVLQEVETIRDLGITLDKKLRFHTHIDKISNKGFQMLGFVLRNCKEIKRPQTKISLYNTLVRPHLEYCSQVWSPYYDVHIKRLERVQKRFLWHLSYQSNLAKHLPSYDSRLAYFQLNSLENRRILLDQLFLHKLINGSIDCPLLLSKIDFNTPLRRPRASKYYPFVLGGSKSNLGLHSTLHRLQKQYNNLTKKHVDIDIFSDNIYKFKTTVRVNF